VVQPLHGGAAADVALGLVLQRRPQLFGRAVLLGLEVELERVAVGVGEAVGGAVAEVAVDPALAATGRLDRAHPPLQSLGAPGAHGHVAQAGALRLGQLEAVALIVAPAAQEHGLPLARLDLHPEHLLEEAQALVRLGREQLGVADVGDVVDHCPSTRARRPSRS
jgi:hypothetical protein